MARKVGRIIAGESLHYKAQLSTIALHFCNAIVAWRIAATLVFTSSHAKIRCKSAKQYTDFKVCALAISLLYAVDSSYNPSPTMRRNDEIYFDNDRVVSLCVRRCA